MADLVKAYNGVISSHLYPDCPFIEKWKQGEFGTWGVGRYRGTWVDPEGVDVCSACYERWSDGVISGCQEEGRDDAR